MHPNLYLKYAPVLLLFLNGCSDDRPKAHGLDQPVAGKIEIPPQTAISKNSSEPNPTYLDPSRVRSRETYDQIFQLAQQDIPKAFHAANKSISGNLTKDEFESRLVIVASALFRALFPNQSEFEKSQCVQLNEILESPLLDELKNQVLIFASSSTQGNAKASLNVAGCAVKWTAADPKTFASIFGDIASVAPKTAVDYVQTLPWNEKYGMGASRIFSEYVMSNPEEASKAANGLSATHPEIYQWAAAGIFQVIRGSDTEAAKAWRSKITNNAAANHADELGYSLRITR